MPAAERQLVNEIDNRGVAQVEIGVPPLRSVLRTSDKVLYKIARCLGFRGQSGKSSRGAHLVNIGQGGKGDTAVGVSNRKQIGHARERRPRHDLARSVVNRVR